MGRFTLFNLGAALALLLAACGGGGGDETMPSPVAAPAQAQASVPSEASQSAGRMVQWLNGLAQSDSAEPLTLDSFAPPKPDDTEPERVS